MGLVIFVLLVLAAVAAYKFRVQLMAKMLGQSETRVRAQLESRKRRR